MTKENLNNDLDSNQKSEESKVTQSESKGGDEARNKTSLLIALVLIPFILFATFGNYVDGGILKTIFNLYNLFFKVAVGLGGLYILHELVEFIYPKKERKDEYWMTMYIFGIVILVPYFLIIFIGILEALGMIKSIVSTTDSVALNAIGEIRGLMLFLILLVLGIMVSIVLGLDLTNTLLIGISSLLFYGFITTFTQLTIHGGWEIIFLFILVVVASDTFAYFGGKKFGTKKMFNEISPNKTTEGTLIGFVSAILIGLIYMVIVFAILGNIAGSLLAGSIFAGKSVYLLLILIPLAALFAPLGDLFFSKIKRTYDKKDFSEILPGHGGVLDRIDSHILAMTVVGFATILFA